MVSRRVETRSAMFSRRRRAERFLVGRWQVMVVMFWVATWFVSTWRFGFGEGMWIQRGRAH